MNISLSSILLFALTIPFIMTFRIGPGDTPFWLFGCIFLSLFIYTFLDILNIQKSRYVQLKSLFLWTTIVLSVGAGFVSAIIVRHQTHPVFQIHDIILQLEAAIRFFIDGKNPWATSYFGTFLEQWHYSDVDVNPALYHFVMQPFYLLFSLPFYVLSIKTFGFFDGRIPLFVLYFSMLIMAFRLVKDHENKFLFVTLLALNPAMIAYTLEGRSDVFMLAFLFGGLYLMQKKRMTLGGVSVALAFAVKQSVWPLFPFYVAYLYFSKKSIKKTLKILLPFFATFFIVVLPFFFWNPKAFLDSTVFYLMGNSDHSYPISGYGLASVLLQLGVIPDKFGTYPFAIWQLIVGLPVFVFFIRLLKKHTTIKVMLIGYALFLFVYWYFSRYFNNSHVGYISMVLIMAYFWPNEEGKK